MFDSNVEADFLGKVFLATDMAADMA